METCASALSKGVYREHIVQMPRRQAQERELNKGGSPDVRRHVLSEWQLFWQNEPGRRWTARVIGNFGQWRNQKHNQIYYFRIWLLSGHRGLQTYLHNCLAVSSVKEKATACFLMEDGMGFVSNSMRTQGSFLGTTLSKRYLRELREVRIPFQ